VLLAPKCKVGGSAAQSVRYRRHCCIVEGIAVLWEGSLLCLLCCGRKTMLLLVVEGDAVDGVSTLLAKL
jgi:hypothetical protein